MKDAKIIKFPEKDQDFKGTMKLLKIADQLDKIIVENLESGKLNLNEVAGILAHRLGSLIRIAEQKQDLLNLCNSVVKKQAESEQK